MRELHGRQGIRREEKGESAWWEKRRKVVRCWHAFSRITVRITGTNGVSMTEAKLIYISQRSRACTVVGFHQARACRVLNKSRSGHGILSSIP